MLSTLAVVLGLVAASTLMVMPAGATTQKVSVLLSPVKTTLGQTAHVSGTVTPAAPGQIVRLQKYAGSTWVNYKWMHLTSASKYNFAISPGASGVYKFRTTAPHAASTSVTLSVYGWLSLAKLTPVSQSEAVDCSSVQTINGTLFTHACRIQEDWNYVDQFFLEWNLSRKCSTFQATIGLDDADTDAAQANMAITDELATSLYSHDFSIGQSSSVSLNISGRLRIKFTSLGLNSSDAEFYEYIDLGNPRILCTWHP